MMRRMGARRVDELQERLGDRCGRGWAAGDAEVDGEDRLRRARRGCLCAEQVAAECAVAERGDAARLRHRVVGDQKGLAHAACDGAGDEEHVGVAR